jgi:hypothetical protein
LKLDFLKFVVVDVHAIDVKVGVRLSGVCCLFPVEAASRAPGVRRVRRRVRLCGAAAGALGDAHSRATALMRRRRLPLRSQDALLPAQAPAPGAPRPSRAMPRLRQARQAAQPRQARCYARACAAPPPPMRRLRQDVCVSERAAHAHRAPPRGRSTLRVRLVQEAVQLQVAGARAPRQGAPPPRQALLRGVRQDAQLGRGLQATQPHPHRREALSVCCLQRCFQADVRSAQAQKEPRPLAQFLKALVRSSCS